MLDEFRPMLCSTDRSMWTGFKYLNLFLPTTGHIDPDRSYKIWFDEFFNLWSTFSNGPAWEVIPLQIHTYYAKMRPTRNAPLFSRWTCLC